MDKETFLEEEKKLKITVDKIIEEEENIQNTLSKMTMQYDMENLAKGLVLQMYVNKLDNMKKLKNKLLVSVLECVVLKRLMNIIYIMLLKLL